MTTCVNPANILCGNPKSALRAYTIFPESWDVEETISVYTLGYVKHKTYFGACCTDTPGSRLFERKDSHAESTYMYIAENNAL